MKFWIVVLLSLIWGSFRAFAGPAVVTAGEHAGFTRVVIQFGTPVDWQLGRGPQGYGLRIKPDAPVYDTKTVFNLIGKTRLTATYVDPTTGDLMLSLSCACYAMPYEQRPGVVVVDLRDGAAPAGSSFELPLQIPKKGPPKDYDPKASYDWTTLALPPVGQIPNVPLTTNFGMPNLDLIQTLEPLRLALIQDLSRGASQGVVDMIMPTEAAEKPSATVPSQIQMGADLKKDQNQKAGPSAPLTVQRGECWADDQLDISSWGDQKSVAAQMGPQRQGLSGEFDTPDLSAVTRAIRFQIFLGFGAEARSLIRVFVPDFPDAVLWRSMAHILDAEPDPYPAFAGMEDCESAAALWASLADTKATPSSPQAKAAFLRAFSALPPHLRRLLGPDLVDKFVSVGNQTLATAIYHAVQRAPGDQSPELVMMQAKMDRLLGNPETAIAQISDLAKSSGPGSAEALVDLIESQVPLGKPTTFAQVQALEAYLTERRGGPDAQRFQRALILAKAASGDFDGAFAAQKAEPDVEAILWHLLVQSAPNNAFLTLASLGSSDPVSQASIAFAPQIARRMLGLGLFDQAGLWVTLSPETPPELLARVKFSQGDAQAAINLLHADDAAVALQVKAQAYQALGQDKKAAYLYNQLGQPDEYWQSILQAGDWQALADDGPAPWKAVAALLANPAPDTAKGPLAQNKALVERSVATRDAILALLDQVKRPVSAIQ